jgi:hypothetical protein
MIDEDFILENWNLIDDETRQMLKIVGISPRGEA